MADKAKSSSTNQEVPEFASPKGLKTLFNPRSIAIVGASGSATMGMTTAPLEYLLRYKYSGKIFLVNPKYQELKGIKCYPSLAAIPEKIDVVLVLTPDKTVFEHLEESGKKGVKGVIVISSGFAETGAEGLKRQRRLTALAEKYGFVLLGPNCVGLVNVIKGIPITFASGIDYSEILKPGKIGFVSQSGAILSSLVSRAQEWGIGFSHFVGTGNEANLDLVDCLGFMVEDPDTKVIMALVEGIRDVRKFFKVAKLAREKKKPIVVLKLGASEAGRKSAATHTGNMAGLFPVYLGSFRQERILVASGIDDFLLTARTLLQAPLPAGEGIGVVTTTGGGAGLISDVIHREGLRLGNLSPQSVEKISAIMPWYSTAKNPLDFAGQKSSSVARGVYEIFLQDPDIHILLLVVHPQSNKEAFINELIEAGKNFKKPIAVLYMGGTLAPTTEGMMGREDLSFFLSPQECIKSLGNLICYSKYLQSTADTFTINPLKMAEAKAKALKLVTKSGAQITQETKKKLLDCYGIRSARQKLASSGEEALRIAASFGYPVALKIESPDILHKTDFQGVELNIKNESELKQAFKRLQTRFYKDRPNFNIQGILVQEMVTDQVAEVIVGITQDPQFGPTLMFGLGGIMTELLEDVSFRNCPLSPGDAREMIREIKGYRVLNGFRGKPKGDVPALEKALVMLSHLANDLSESIPEMEINPLMVLAKGKGVKAVDTTFLRR